MNPDRLDDIAVSPLLLVATDFDGTISHLAPTPDEATADRRCVEALVRLSSIPATRVAVISGRPLDWLRQRLAELPDALFFGSHGAEDPSVDRTHPADDPALRLRIEGLASELNAVLSTCRGWLIETKPAAVAVHFRTAAPDAIPQITRRVHDFATTQPALFLREGSMVLELCLLPQTKREAIVRAAFLAGSTHSVFFGDDATDEDAFAALGANDLAFKVGPGDSCAPYRVSSVAEVADTLARLAELRARYFASRAIQPIQHHSVLSDQRTLAIVTPAARVTWLCLPRIDSPAVFAELVGDPSAGYFAIEPLDDPATPVQSYLSDCMILQTKWSRCTLTDYLDCSGGRAFQRAGRTDLVRVLEGSGKVRVRFAPRHDFARTPTTLEVRPDGLLMLAGNDPCALHAPNVRWILIDEPPHQTAEAIVDLDACDGRCVLELRFGTANLRPAMVDEPLRRQQTARHWAGWASTLSIPAFDHDPRLRAALVRSALVLRALCHGPTGAIAAAATTSLPEQLGGVRNWDYRFCWPRDAAMSASSLVRLGNTGHAMKLADWLAAVVERLDAPERLRPIYAVRGEELGPEAEITNLTGYLGSRPVRVGNAAAHQVQLDVFGPIVDMVASMTERGVPVSPDAWRLVRAMVHAVEARWQEPDHGIWEVRGPKRHHVHSKVMCWHAVNRALLVHEVMVGSESSSWRTLRDTIAADVLAQAWNPRVNAFTGAYGSDDLDASVLFIGLTGLIPTADPRWVATVDAINSRLRDGAAVYRYLSNDGLPGREGGFVIAACWLVEALASLNRLSEARALFRDVLAQAGPTGLLAEQWDPTHRMALGNFPQAYSHLGVINAALALHEAERRTRS